MRTDCQDQPIGSHLLAESLNSIAQLFATKPQSLVARFCNQIISEINLVSLIIIVCVRDVDIAITDRVESSLTLVPLQQYRCIACYK